MASGSVTTMPTWICATFPTTTTRCVSSAIRSHSHKETVMTTITFTSTRALLTKITEDDANWQDEPSVRSEFVFCRMHDWALLGRVLDEMSDQANAQADATDD